MKKELPQILGFKESFWILEPKETQPSYILESVGITYPDERYRIERPEGVDFYTIEYVVSGKGTINIDGHNYTPHEGDVYILPPNTPVKYWADRTTPWQKIWINIRGELVESLLSSYELQGHVLYRNCPLKDLFEQMIVCVKSHKEKTALELALMLHRIIAELSLWKSTSGHKEVSETYLKLRQYCDEHWRDGFHLEELASLINRSPIQTLRIFRKDFGMTPGRWLQNKRLAFAKQYLLNTNSTIRNLTEYLGFTDEFYFANWFRKHAGIAPGKFRKSKFFSPQNALNALNDF